jgi:hypothetical protein
MNDQNQMMFDYLLQMGAMQPQQKELERKQAMIDALRKQSMTSPEGQMIGRHYVAPSWTEHLATLGQGYMAAKGQGTQDAAMKKMNETQRQDLIDLRNRQKQQQMQQQMPPMQSDPYDRFRFPNEA